MHAVRRAAHAARVHTWNASCVGCLRGATSRGMLLSTSRQRTSAAPGALGGSRRSVAKYGVSAVGRSRGTSVSARMHAHASSCTVAHSPRGRPSGRQAISACISVSSWLACTAARQWENIRQCAGVPSRQRAGQHVATVALRSCAERMICARLPEICTQSIQTCWRTVEQCRALTVS
jgi:hypothetical protein